MLSLLTMRLLFLLIVLGLAVQRLLEVRLSRTHEAALRAKGGQEHAPGHFAVMRALHVLWFVAMVTEVYLWDRPFVPWLAVVALLLLLSGQALRYAAIRTLGERWTVRIYTLPGTPPITEGIFRYVRHPNYLGVILEIAAVPLLHTAYLTSIFFSIANALLLRVRIREEERALTMENEYETAFANRPRFF